MANLKDFFNKISNNNRIFTAEDIGEMSGNEYAQNEKAIFHQLQNLGIPRRNQLNGNSNVVYVHAYTKTDGTQVKAHYRSKNGNSITSGTTNMDNNKDNITLYGSVTKNDNSLSGNAISDYLLGMFNDYKSIEYPLNSAAYTLGSFLTNYNEMKDADTHGADKYFHARANYNAAQQGIVGSVVAKMISDLREWTDNYRNINEKGYDPTFSIQDIKEDQRANEEGRELGRRYPTAPAYEKLKHLMPNGFPERYKRR